MLKLSYFKVQNCINGKIGILILSNLLFLSQKMPNFVHNAFNLKEIFTNIKTKQKCPILLDCMIYLKNKTVNKFK